MSNSIKHILVPTDGSDSAIDAARTAGDLARALNADVTVLFVHPEDIVPALAWEATVDIEDIRKRMEQNAREGALPETAAAVGELDSSPVQTQTWGHPAEKVCEFASENGVDLIVMGSHGRSKFKRALLGSVSNGVVNHAPCAVTIVPQGR